MRAVAAVFLLLGLVAVPAKAQVTPGGNFDVYDANSDLIGRLVAIGYEGDLSISVDVPDGDVAIIRYVDSPEAGQSPRWWSYLYFELPDCMGLVYPEWLDGPRSDMGYRYMSGLDSNLYRVDANVPLAPFSYQSYFDPTGCQNGSGATNGIVGEFVVSLTSVFPLEYRAAAPSAPLLPPWAYATIAGVLGMTGGWLAKRRNAA